MINDNMKNLIAKRFKRDQSDYSDRISRDNKSSTCLPWTKSLANAVATMGFHEFHVILTISFEFSLRLAIPLQSRQSLTYSKPTSASSSRVVKVTSKCWQQKLVVKATSKSY